MQKLTHPRKTSQEWKSENAIRLWFLRLPRHLVRE